MNIKIQTGSALEARLLAFFQDEEPQGDISPSALALVQEMLATKEFEAKFGETRSLRLQDAPRHLILIGLGKRPELSLEKVRRVVGKGVKEAIKLKTSSLDIDPVDFGGLDPLELARIIGETAQMAAYSFDTYKSEAKEKHLQAINLVAGAELDQALLEGVILGEATILARRLVNEPANIMTPAKLAEEAAAVGQSYGLDVEILEEEQIRALGMEAFLAVARASENRPRLIVLRHQGDPQSDRTLALVGKGLTYDSGGLSIKPTEGMAFMKCDMGGAAAVIGAMAAIGKLQPKTNVVGIVAACENMISGGSYKPGDIIGSMAGKTIEVGNTDAEGRITLADAVTYAIRQEKATQVLDIATLTGAALIALGATYTAVLANDDGFYDQLVQAAELAGEKIWRLPQDEEYKEMLKSDVADFSNVSAQRLAGTITAGLFIGAFAEELPWLHLDIAGTAWGSKDGDYTTKGGTGWGVRTLYHLVKGQ